MAEKSYFIEFDGGVKKIQDETIGAIGCVVKKYNDEIIHSHNEIRPDIHSNTKAEYLALEYGLEYVSNIHVPSESIIYIFGDERSILDVLNPDKSDFSEKQKFKNHVNNIQDYITDFKICVFSCNLNQNDDAHAAVQKAFRNYSNT